MPDAIELLKTRRSVTWNFLTDPGPSEDEIREILTIGARVPDHGKLAPWRFIVVKGEHRAAAGEALQALYRQKNPDMPEEKATEQLGRIGQPPLTIMVVSKTAEHPKIPEWEQFLAGGNAAMNIVLAANALGYGAHWVSGFPSTDDDASALFGVVGEEHLIALIHIGTPSDRLPDRARPDIDDITTWWEPAEQER